MVTHRLNLLALGQFQKICLPFVVWSRLLYEMVSNRAFCSAQVPSLLIGPNVACIAIGRTSSQRDLRRKFQACSRHLAVEIGLIH